METSKNDSKIEKDDNLIAVVMSDDFDENFAVLTGQKPKCLLPLANKAMIEYTLEFLQSSNVQDCYVYCSMHALQIKEHLSKKKWIKSTSTVHHVRRSKMNVHVIADENCHSFGDAIRDLDEKGILRSHFILISAFVVSNVHLDPLIKEHKRRYNDNKNTTLTLLYQHAEPGHQSRSKSQEVLLVTKRENNRVVYHSRAQNSFQRGRKGQNTVQFPLEIFTGNANDEMEIRYDLVDTGIAICAPTVPLQFAERFDCQSLDDFIKGSIEDDIADHFLYASVIGEIGNVCTGYASKVADVISYLSISTDILNRWAYPLVPDANVSSIGKKTYTISRHNVYKAESALLMKGSTLQEAVIVGRDTVIGENSFLVNVSVGKGCTIGPNSSISNCIIHDNVIIGRNCQLNECIVGENVEIGASIVSVKTIMGPGIHINDNCKEIKPYTWMSSTKIENGSDDKFEWLPDLEMGPSVFLLKQKIDKGANENEKPDLTWFEDVWGVLALSDEDNADSSFPGDDTDIDSDAENGTVLDINDSETKFQRFYHEVLESLQRGFEDNTEEGNLILEINASRHAYAMTQSQVVRCIIMSVLSIGTMAAKQIDTTSNTLLAEVRTKLDFFKSVIQRYVKNESSEFDCLKGIEQHCQQDQNFLIILNKIVYFMYDQMDVLSEEAILSYHYNQSVADDFQYEQVNENSIPYKIRKKLDPLIQWLENAESDDTDSGISIPKL